MTDGETSKVLVDENTAAELMSVSGKTLYLWRKAGMIPFVKVGRLIRYRVDSLIDFAKQHEDRDRKLGAC